MFFFLADRRVFGEALKKPEKKIAENNLCSAFNSLPQSRRGTRIGGNGSYKPPGAP